MDDFHGQGELKLISSERDQLRSELRRQVCARRFGVQVDIVDLVYQHLKEIYISSQRSNVFALCTNVREALFVLGVPIMIAHPRNREK